jgi:hypothetical protein
MMLGVGTAGYTQGNRLVASLVVLPLRADVAVILAAAALFWEFLGKLAWMAALFAGR